MADAPAPMPVSWKPNAKIIAASLTAVVAIAGALIALYSSGNLSLATSIPAVAGPLLPVLAGYLKAL